MDCPKTMRPAKVDLLRSTKVGRGQEPFHFQCATATRSFAWCRYPCLHFARCKRSAARFRVIFALRLPRLPKRNPHECCSFSVLPKVVARSSFCEELFVFRTRLQSVPSNLIAGVASETMEVRSWIKTTLLR